MGQALSQLHNWNNSNMPSTRNKRENVRPDVEIENVERKPKKGRPTTNKNTKEPISSEKIKGKLQGYYSKCFNHFLPIAT